MSQNEISRTFPPGEQLGLEPESFKNVLRPALLKYLEVNSTEKPEPRTYTRTIIQLDDKDESIHFRELPFPLYFGPWETDTVQKAISSEELKKLLDYIWERGEMRMTLSGRDPDRRGWEKFVMMDVIHTPLNQILNEAAIDEVIDTSHFTPWHLPGPLLEKSLDELVLRFCYRQHRYIAKCPLRWIEASPGTMWKLADGVNLCLYTQREKIGYLTRYFKNLTQHEISDLLWSGVAILEITQSITTQEERMGRDRKTGIEIMEEEITDWINLIKWALMVGLNQSGSLIEEKIVHRDILGGESPIYGAYSFRRQSANQGTSYKLDNHKIAQVKDLINKALTIRNHSNDLRDALWYWGKSCTARLERDMLLESVIGMEHLLVPNPGESSYRFRLHGAALLASSGEDTIKYADDLKKIYRKRSSASHGNREQRLSEAQKAFQYLARTIQAIIELSISEKLDPSKRISEQIEIGILKGSPLRNAPVHKHD